MEKKLRPTKNRKDTHIHKVVAGRSLDQGSLCTPQLSVSAVVSVRQGTTDAAATVRKQLSSKTIHPATGAQLHLPDHTAFLDKHSDPLADKLRVGRGALDSAHSGQALFCGKRSVEVDSAL